MKKFVRFAGVALLALTIGVASCGDDDDPVAPVAPPVPPTPPPPPVVVTMAPASQTIGVGGTVVFAVSVSGGVAGEAASWTCASSDPSKATVIMTSAGCAATAVAAGGVTITAAVTKGGATVNTAAGLTILEDMAERALLFIASIKNSDKDDEDDEVLSRRVSVTLSVELGDQMLRKLSVLVDGVVAEIRSFDGASVVAAAPEGEDGERAAQQAVHPFVLSFNSAEYDEVTGEPTYMNGERMISAKLMVASSDEPIESGSHPREFGNDDGVQVTVSGLGEGAMNSETGQRWYGGPEAALEMTALPILYSGGSAASVSVTLLAFCGADAATETSETSVTFTPECDATSNTAATVIDEVVTDPAGDSPVFVIADAEVDILNDDVFPLYLDYEGPDAPYFKVNPNDREDGWVNRDVDFLDKYHSSRNEDGWLVYNEDKEGVGGYAPQLRFSSTTPSIVDGAREATANAFPTAATKKNAACVIATAVDLLGNESKLPSAGKPCVTDAAYQAAVDVLKMAEDAENDDDIADARGDIPAGIRAGLDVTAPTIEFSASSAREDGTSLKEFQVQVADAGGSTGKSGLHSDPVLAKVEVRGTDGKMICGDDPDVGGAAGEESVSGVCELAGGLDFNDPLATTSGLVAADTDDGYYTFTAEVRDKAGNRSEQRVRTAVNDNEPPNVGVIVGAYDKGSYPLTVTVTDNLSIAKYWAEMRFAEDNQDLNLGTGAVIGNRGLVLPREGGVAVDDYNAALTQSHLTSPPLTVQILRGLHSVTSPTTVMELLSIGVVAVDQAGSSNELAEGALGPLALDNDGFLIRTAATNISFEDQEMDDAPAYDKVFQTFTVDETVEDDGVVELRAELAGTNAFSKAVEAVEADDANNIEFAAEVPGVEGLASNPVSRVDFYAAVALRKVSSAEGAADRIPPVAYGVGSDALKLIASVNGNTAGSADDAGVRTYVYGIDISTDAFLEAVGGSGDFTTGYIIAVAVNSAGVGVYSEPFQITVEE